MIVKRLLNECYRSTIVQKAFKNISTIVLNL